MQLKKVREYIDRYAKFLGTRSSDSNLYKWESQAIFQQNWNLAAPDFVEMYDASLQNSTTRRLWKRDNYDPKAMMKKFIKMEPEYVRHAFTDLFDENKDIEGRVDRFVFYCDQFLEQYKEENPLKIDNNHYHGDYYLVSIYLAFRYPENYSIYSADLFQGALQRLGSMDVPKINDVGRFFKVSRTLQKMLNQNESVMEGNKKRIVDPRLYKDETLLLAHDFMGAIFAGHLEK
ncbi:MAG: hypothetical protein AB8G22_01635 [Saprospiraceae bacterium]